jgi:hypothetical protein
VVIPLLLALWAGPSSSAPVREVAQLQFYSAFWPNLHHTLYVAGLPAGPTAASVLRENLTAGMTGEDRAVWERGVAYYARQLSVKDLRTGDRMAAINEALSAAGDALDAGGAISHEHVSMLQAVAPVYRRVLWPEHDRLNREWIDNVAGRLEQLAPAIVPRLVRVYDTPWFSAPVRVDITYYGRAYTYLRPRQHTVMASADPDYAGWAGAEMVLHEASHGLVDRLATEIDRQSALVKREPRDLWHLALFYMVGEITRETLAARGVPYTPYLYAAGVIDRGWPGERVRLESRLKRYVDEERTAMSDGMNAWLAPGLFTFRIGFWNSLHHFLYVLGRAKNNLPDAQREAVVNAPKDVEGLASRSEAERAAWEDAVAFYAAGPSKKDAVFDSDLVRQTRRIAANGSAPDVSGSDLDPALVATLKKAAPIYRAVWWPRHQRAAAARRDELQALVETHGEALVKRLTSLYHTTWPAEPRTIDLVAYANWAGAYSTDEGLIVIGSMDDYGGTLALEALLHESSHQWDEEIQRRLSEIAAKVGKRVPPNLSHALIFYTTGAIVKEAFPSHVPLGEKAGVWNRGLASLKPLLERDWQPYLRGETTFEAAIAAVIDDARSPLTRSASAMANAPPAAAASAPGR